MTLKCEKCSKEASGEQGHIGRKHKACSGRKKGSATSYAGCGKWKAA